jgi:hypothetical protein
MSALDGINLAWFPLVPRPRPPGHPLEERVAELTALAESASEGTHRERVTRASEVLNKAALIASDCGVPDLARDLCRRHYILFAAKAPLPAWAVKLALQPLLNIPRQLVREGRPADARALLEALQQAATDRTATTIDGTTVDFATLTGTPDAHKEARTLTWTALLADGTRALARTGRWQEAADLATAHRGVGTRLLDGRQIAILAHLRSGNVVQATELVEASRSIELGEQAIQSVLRVLCQQAAEGATGIAIDTMLDTATTLAKVPDRATTVGRTRIGMTAIGIANAWDVQKLDSLRTMLADAAMTDAYAARDLIVARHLHDHLSALQRAALRDVIRACGLGAGLIPAGPLGTITSAVRRAEARLSGELRPALA